MPLRIGLDWAMFREVVREALFSLRVTLPGTVSSIRDTRVDPIVFVAGDKRLGLVFVFGDPRLGHVVVV